MIVIVALGSIYYLYSQGLLNLSPGSTYTPTPSVTKSANIKVENLSTQASQIQKLLPSGTPLETGAEILSSTKQTYKNPTRILISAQFVSKKSIAENYVLYQSYLKTGGYTITNQSNQKDFAALYGTSKDNKTFVFTASIDAQKRVVVSLAYSQ